MVFNENKFEQTSHGSNEYAEIESYKTPKGEEIQIKKTVKDLGVMSTNDLMFQEQIKK